jgi:hypothetical protein
MATIERSHLMRLWRTQQSQKGRLFTLAASLGDKSLRAELGPNGTKPDRVMAVRY